MGPQNFGNDLRWLFGKPTQGQPGETQGNPWANKPFDPAFPLNPLHWLYTPPQPKKDTNVDPRDLSKTPLGPALDELKGTKDKTGQFIKDRMSPTDPNSGQMTYLHAQNQKLIDDFKAEWKTAGEQFKVGAAETAQRTIGGLWSSFNQQSTDMASQMRAAGIPEDQIQGQVRQMKMSTGFEVGRTLSETGVVIKSKLLDFNQNMNATYATLGSTLSAQESSSDAALAQSLTNLELGTSQGIAALYQYWMDIIGPQSMNLQLGGL